MWRVVISEDAFFSLITGITEVYPREAYGMLLGYKRRGAFHVQHAFPYQSVYRSRGEVCIAEKAERRLISAANFVRGCKYLGEFHSHAEGACALSKYDRADLLESGDCFSMLLSIEETDRFKPWSYNVADKCLSGTINRDFLIMIKAYYRAHNERRIKKLRLRCDFIQKLNKRIKRDMPFLLKRAYKEY